MSDVVFLDCPSCGARISGVRTEFGSLVVPGHEGCPRCGSTELSEATSDGRVEAEAESPTESGTDSATE